jgi:hypothetical protein
MSSGYRIKTTAAAASGTAQEFPVDMNEDYDAQLIMLHEAGVARGCGICSIEKTDRYVLQQNNACHHRPLYFTLHHGMSFGAGIMCRTA